MSGSTSSTSRGNERHRRPGRPAPYAAVRLFIERAVAVRPGFTVTNENAPAVAAISARLHGMPLAIELAAARIKILSPDAILVRLEHQLDLLAGRVARPAGPAADAPRRDRLELRPARRGGAAPARSAVGLRERLRPRGGGGDLRPVVRDSVAHPRRADGARRPEPHQGRGRPTASSRFRLLDTIREFAAERLDAGGDVERVRARHRDWFRRSRHGPPRSCRAPTSAAGSTGSSSSTTTSAPSSTARSRRPMRRSRSASRSRCGDSGRSTVTWTRRAGGSRPWRRRHPGRAMTRGSGRGSWRRSAAPTGGRATSR